MPSPVACCQQALLGMLIACPAAALFDRSTQRLTTTASTYSCACCKLCCSRSNDSASPSMSPGSFSVSSSDSRSAPTRSTSALRTSQSTCTGGGWLVGWLEGLVEGWMGWGGWFCEQHATGPAECMVSTAQAGSPRGQPTPRAAAHHNHHGPQPAKERGVYPPHLTTTQHPGQPATMHAPPGTRGPARGRRWTARGTQRHARPCGRPPRWCPAPGAPGWGTRCRRRSG